jgi:preprotein translocase subunit SecG
MNMFYALLIILHVVVSFLLVVAILMQSSKGGGLAGSPFGGGGSSMAFLGARGTANFFSRATTVLAVVFMLNSLALSLLIQGRKAVSVTQQSIQQTSGQNLPRVPGGPGAENVNPQVPITQPPGTQQQGQQTQPTPGQPPAGEEHK